MYSKVIQFYLLVDILIEAVTSVSPVQESSLDFPERNPYCSQNIVRLTSPLVLAVSPAWHACPGRHRVRGCVVSTRLPPAGRQSRGVSSFWRKPSPAFLPTQPLSSSWKWPGSSLASRRGLLSETGEEGRREVLLRLRLRLQQLLGQRACQPGQLGQLEQRQQL